jgi:hypothetical protein
MKKLSPTNKEKPEILESSLDRIKSKEILSLSKNMKAFGKKSQILLPLKLTSSNKTFLHLSKT